MHATPDSTMIATVAIDLAKEVFELACADTQWHLLERRRLTRSAFAKTFDNVPPRRIVMEACGTAHYWGRRFQRHGHTVKLLPAQAVHPYVRGNKTDRTDAVGLFEADRCERSARCP